MYTISLSVTGGLINKFDFCGGISVPSVIPQAAVEKGINWASGLLQTATNAALGMTGTKVTLDKVSTSGCPADDKKKLLETCFDPPILGKTCLEAKMTEVTNKEYALAISGSASAEVRGMAKLGQEFAMCTSVVLPSIFNLKGVSGVIKKADNLIGKAVATVTKAGEGVSKLFAAKGALSLGNLEEGKCDTSKFDKEVFDQCVKLGALGKSCLAVHLPGSEVKTQLLQERY